MTNNVLEHADLMDRVYKYQRHFYDATRKWYLLGRDQMLHNLAHLPANATVLEAGCGTARNLLVANEINPTLRYYGIDASDQMLRTARRQITAAGPGARINVRKADITAFDPDANFGLTQFDWIICSYTLSMVPRWPLALNRLIDCLAPGGVIQIIDFGSQREQPAVFRMLLTTWLNWFHVEPCQSLAQTFVSTCANKRLTDVSVKELYRGYTIQLSAQRGD